MYDGVEKKFENVSDSIDQLDSRLEEIEETMEALLQKLGVHVHYTIDDDFRFKASVVENTKAKAPKTKKANAVKTTPRGKK